MRKQNLAERPNEAEPNAKIISSAPQPSEHWCQESEKLRNQQRLEGEAARERHQRMLLGCEYKRLVFQ